MKNYYFSFLFLFSLSFSTSQILFEDEAGIRGISTHTGTVGNGNGLSFIDYNCDGLDDITLPSGNGIPLRFYKNIDGFFVEEILIEPQIIYQTRSVSWVDYDNDGDKDLFIASDTDGNRLYQQNSDGTFDNVTVSSGLFEDNIFTYGISWGDVNNDGCLDLYLSNRVVDDPISNYFFMNNCDGTFSNATEMANLVNVPALSFIATFFDYNNDGWQDLYVSNDKQNPNFMYKNNGNGTFTDVSALTKTNLIVDAMSVTIDDYNNDGFFDIYITNTPNNQGTPTLGSVLLKNNNGIEFEDVSHETGTLLDSWTWGANFLDADNDEDLDLYVSGSFIQADGYPSFAFYQNNGDESFNLTNNSVFQNNDFRSYGSAVGDANNDGLPDIAVINNFDQTPNLWVNNSTNNNNYLAVSLQSTQSNKDGIGSVIELSVDGKIQYRYIANGESYLSQNSLSEIFGIGTATQIDYVKVKWLSGIEDVVYNISPNQKLTIVEGNNVLDIKGSEKKDLKFWPIPFQDTIHISSSTNIDSYELYDTNGRFLDSIKVNALSFNINTSNLQSGTYILTLKSKNASLNKLVLKK